MRTPTTVDRDSQKINADELSADQYIEIYIYKINEMKRNM